MPPLWKIKREIKRIGRKLHWVSVDTASLWYRHLPFPLIKSYFLRETTGALPLTDRVAIFVLFQPKGIAASTFFTLSHLAQENWSVVVVSNAALSDADRTKIAKHSAQVIVRPNIDYDFGAYRDGWYWLQHRRQPLSRLIMMNDSTWFPLRADDSSLARMEQHGSDLTGHIYKCESAERYGQDHIEAHLLMFSTRLLTHPTLHNFWRGYKMSSSRSKTIYRGEKGIAQHLLTDNFNFAGILGLLIF
jgi:lipopolysaccharide biosynthesis protein